MAANYKMLLEQCRDILSRVDVVFDGEGDADDELKDRVAMLVAQVHLALKQMEAEAN